jgi:hypothetical protein
MSARTQATPIWQRLPRWLFAVSTSSAKKRNGPFGKGLTRAGAMISAIASAARSGMASSRAWRRPSAVLVKKRSGCQGIDFRIEPAALRASCPGWGDPAIEGGAGRVNHVGCRPPQQTGIEALSNERNSIYIF